MDKLLQIINGCARQDRQFQKLLYEQYYEFSLKITFRYMNSYEQAVEVTHNGFLRIFRDFGNFSIPGKDQAETSLLKWIKEEVIGTILEVMKPEMASAFLSPPPSLLYEHFPEYPAKPFSENLELYNELITTLKELPLASRMIFNLYVIDGYSHAEIAKMLGISIWASYSYLETARAHCYRPFRLCG